MVDLNAYLAKVDERQRTMDCVVGACMARGDMMQAVMYYADLLTSCYGEKWDQKAKFIELDDMLEALKKKGVMFNGQPISDRRTDKEDMNVIRYITTVPNKKTVKNPDGTKTHFTNGTKQSTKTKHVHAETMMLYNMTKTNLIGLYPVTISSTEFFKGRGSAYINSSNRKVDSKNVSLQLRKPIRANKDTFTSALGAKLAERFFGDIDKREQYALANIATVTINRIGDTAVTAGLVRMDYDIINDQPVCVRTMIAFLLDPLVKNGISNPDIVKHTQKFICNMLEKQGVMMAPNAEQFVFVPGGMEKFKLALENEANKMYSRVKRYDDEYGRKEAILYQVRNNEEARERREAAEAEEARLRKQQEREEAKARREKEREAAKAAKAERTAQAKARRDAAAAKTHNKVIQATIKQIVTDLLKNGVTPTKEVYQNLRQQIRANEGNSDDCNIVCEALTLLINTDTSQADQEVAQLAAAQA